MMGDESEWCQKLLSSISQEERHTGGLLGLILLMIIELEGGGYEGVDTTRATFVIG